MKLLSAGAQRTYVFSSKQTLEERDRLERTIRILNCHAGFPIFLCRANETDPPRAIFHRCTLSGEKRLGKRGYLILLCTFDTGEQVNALKLHNLAGEMLKAYDARGTCLERKRTKTRSQQVPTNAYTRLFVHDGQQYFAIGHLITCDVSSGRTVVCVEDIPQPSKQLADALPFDYTQYRSRRYTQEVYDLHKHEEQYIQRLLANESRMITHARNSNVDVDALVADIVHMLAECFHSKCPECSKAHKKCIEHSTRITCGCGTVFCYACCRRVTRFHNYGYNQWFNAYRPGLSFACPLYFKDVSYLCPKRGAQESTLWAECQATDSFHTLRAFRVLFTYQNKHGIPQSIMHLISIRLRDTHPVVLSYVKFRQVERNLATLIQWFNA